MADETLPGRPPRGMAAETENKELNDVVLRPRHGLSLAAGAGGLDMGLMLAEPGFETRCWVELDDAPRQRVIAAQRAGYFAPAPIWDDVRTFDGRPWHGAIDTVLAGYPCQPFSYAGSRRGEDDPRHIWPDIARIVSEIGPRWVFLENVEGHVSLGAEDVLRELQGMGYATAAGLFSAAEVGAPHRRKRWFCVAYADSTKLAEYLQHQHSTSGWEEPHELAQLRRRTGLFPPEPGDTERWGAVLERTPDLAPAASPRDLKYAADHYAGLVAARRMAETEAQSRLCRMANGMADRTRALRILGNGVVPLAAAHAWRSLAAAHGLRPVDLAADLGAGEARA